MSCSQCPTVKQWSDEYNELSKEFQVYREEQEAKIIKLRESLEATVLLCKYNCCAASHCGRCRVALEALGEINEYGEVIGPGGV